MPATDSIELKDVRRLNLKPNDTLVVRLDDPSQAEIESIAHGLKRYFPDNKVLVLARLSEIEVVEAAA
jgi:hypothetical protein